MFLVPWSIVHIQIIRQLCQKRRIWIAGLHTPSGLHHSQPPSPCLDWWEVPTRTFLWFGKGELPEAGRRRCCLEGVECKEIARKGDSQMCPSAERAQQLALSQSALPPLLWLHQHSRMFADPLQHPPGRSAPLNWRSFSSELTATCAVWVNISVLVCWRREGGEAEDVMFFPLVPYRLLTFLAQEICWVSVEGQGNLLLKVVLFSLIFPLLYSFLSHKNNKTSPKSHIHWGSMSNLCTLWHSTVTYKVQTWEPQSSYPLPKKATPNSQNVLNTFMILLCRAALIFRCMSSGWTCLRTSDIIWCQVN